MSAAPWIGNWDEAMYFAESGAVLFCVLPASREEVLVAPRAHGAVLLRGPYLGGAWSREWIYPNLVAAVAGYADWMRRGFESDPVGWMSDRAQVKACV